jgi:hypothetical protein
MKNTPSNDLLEELFWKIYNSGNETELHKVVQCDSLLSNPQLEALWH